MIGSVLKLHNTVVILLEMLNVHFCPHILGDEERD